MHFRHALLAVALWSLSSHAAVISGKRSLPSEEGASLYQSTSSRVKPSFFTSAARFLQTYSLSNEISHYLQPSTAHAHGNKGAGPVEESDHASRRIMEHLKDHPGLSALAQNEEPLSEHLEGKHTPHDTYNDDDDEDMLPLLFWFQVHDINGDSHLDGHELRHAFTDHRKAVVSLESHHHHSDTMGDANVYTVDENFVPLRDVINMVDHVLEEDDINGDSRISIDDYLFSQRLRS
jgi:hypothetical protein